MAKLIIWYKGNIKAYDREINVKPETYLKKSFEKDNTFYDNIEKISYEGVQIYPEDERRTYQHNQTNTETKEKSIHKLRNLMSPIVNYFTMVKALHNNSIEENKIEEWKNLIDQQYQYIQDGNLDEIITLIKDPTKW